MDKLHQLLIESQYDTAETQFLINGFTHGFTIGCAGPVERQQRSHNLQLKYGTATDLWNKVMKEVKLKFLNAIQRSAT